MADCLDDIVHMRMEIDEWQIIPGIAKERASYRQEDRPPDDTHAKAAEGQDKHDDIRHR